MARLNVAMRLTQMAALSKNEGSHYREANTRPLCCIIFLFIWSDRRFVHRSCPIGSRLGLFRGQDGKCERASASGMTAAHRTLPFGTLVRITHRRNGHSVVVRINDRGPFVRGRVIDVTPAAARALGFSGLASVTLDVIGRRG